MNQPPPALPPPLPNWDFLQRGYDVVYLDPTTLAEVDSNPPPTNPPPFGVRQYVFNMTPGTACPGDGSYSMPPECSSSFPFLFQSNSTTDILQISSDIAEANASSIVVQGSDPTGSIWSCSGSSKTASRRQTISNRGTTASTTHASYQFYQLQIPNWGNTQSSPPMPSLSKSFLAAVVGLSSQSDVVPNIVQVYGTHFATQVMFGGIANLDFNLASSDVSSLTSSSQSLTAQASVCFEIVKAGGTISGNSQVSQQYQQAISNQSQSLVTVGGSASSSISEWETTVQASPSPIQVWLQPLWVLPQLTLPKSPVTTQQIQWLQNGILAYMSSGANSPLTQSILNYGDTVVLQPVNGLTPEGADLVYQPGIQPKVAPATGVQSTVSEPLGITQLVDLYPGGTQLDQNLSGLTPISGEASPFELVLVNPANPSDTSLVNCANPICFAAVGTSSPQLLLDSEGGNNSNQGNVALSSNAVTALSTQWTIYPLSSPSQPVAATLNAYNSLAHEDNLPIAANNSVSHGDAVSIQRMYVSKNPNDPQGFLSVVNNNLFSHGGYSHLPITGNSCFFRILLVLKGPTPTIESSE